MSNLVIVFAPRLATYMYPSGPSVKATGAPSELYKNFTLLGSLSSMTNTLPLVTSVKKRSFRNSAGYRDPEYGLPMPTIAPTA